MDVIRLSSILTREDGCYRIYDYFFSYWIANVY